MSNKISLRDNITIAEKDAFIKQVVSDAFTEITKPNYLMTCFVNLFFQEVYFEDVLEMRRRPQHCNCGNFAGS